MAANRDAGVPKTVNDPVGANETEEQKSLRRIQESAKRKIPVIKHIGDGETSSSGAQNNPKKTPLQEPGYIESLFPTPQQEVTTRDQQLDQAIQQAARAEKRQRLRWIQGIIGIVVIIILLAIMLPILLTR